MAAGLLALPRLLDGTGLRGVENRISAPHAGTGLLAPSRFVYDVPAFAAPLADLLQHGPLRSRLAPHPRPRPASWLDGVR